METEAIVVAVVAVLVLTFVVAIGTGLIHIPAESGQKLLEIVPAEARFASIINVSEYKDLAKRLGADHNIIDELSKAEYVVSFVTDRYAVSLAVGGDVSDVVKEMGTPESVEEYRGYKIYRYGPFEGGHTVAEGEDVVIVVMGDANIQRIIDIVEDGPRERFVDKPYVREALDAVGGSLMVVITDLSSMAGKTAIAAVGAEKVGNKVKAKTAICGEDTGTFLGLFQGAELQQSGPCVVSEREMNISEFAGTMGGQPLP